MSQSCQNFRSKNLKANLSSSTSASVPICLFLKFHSAYLDGFVSLHLTSYRHASPCRHAKLGRISKVKILKNHHNVMFIAKFAHSLISFGNVPFCLFIIKLSECKPNAQLPLRACLHGGSRMHRLAGLPG